MSNEKKLVEVELLVDQVEINDKMYFKSKTPTVKVEQSTADVMVKHEFGKIKGGK